MKKYELDKKGLMNIDNIRPGVERKGSWLLRYYRGHNLVEFFQIKTGSSK